jgi:hypothetical protein
MTLPYPPPFQDLATLSAHICAAESTIENWVKLGLFPGPTKKVGGKRLWRWKDVERHLAVNEGGGAASPAELADRIKNATKAATREHDQERIIRRGDPGVHDKPEV